MRRQPFLGNGYVRSALGLALLCFGVAVVLGYRAFSGADHLLVIRFTGGRGIDFLGDARDVTLFLTVGGFAYAVNAFLAHALYPRGRIFAYLIAAFTLFLSVLILIAVIAMISVN